MSDPPGEPATGATPQRNDSEPRAADFRAHDEFIAYPPPFQPVRAFAALALTAAGFALQRFLLLNFWRSPWLGIHERVPWAAYAILIAAAVLALAAVGVALSIGSPHAKLGFSLLAFLACVAVCVGGARFVSYTLRGTLNPSFHLTLAAGEQFPSFALADQDGVVRRGPGTSGSGATLIYIYRGDFCPFARYELLELTEISAALGRDGVKVVAISADPIDRSKMLAGFLHTGIPLLSDTNESLLGPMGLVQHHPGGEPDSAIPAFFIVDRAGVVRWLFTSPYYRELPAAADLVAAARTVVSSRAN